MEEDNAVGVAGPFSIAGRSVASSSGWARLIPGFRQTNGSSGQDYLDGHVPSSSIPVRRYGAKAWRTSAPVLRYRDAPPCHSKPTPLAGTTFLAGQRQPGDELVGLRCSPQASGGSFNGLVQATRSRSAQISPRPPAKVRLRDAWPSAIAIGTDLGDGVSPGAAAQTWKGLIGSIIRQIGLDLATPDHSTPQPAGRWTLEIVRAPANAKPLHLLVDSTGSLLVRCRRVAGREAWHEPAQGVVA